MLEKLDHMFQDIEEVLGNDRISEETRIDYASAIFRSNAQFIGDAKIIKHVIGDIVHEITKNYISYFRLYLPLLLRIYSGFTGSTNAYYLGFTPGRENEIQELSIKPTIALKALIDNDIFRWGLGEVYEFERFVKLSNSGQCDTTKHLIMEGVNTIFRNSIDFTNSMIIPLSLKISDTFKNEPYGFVILTNNERKYVEPDINIASKITSYFTTHLRNFEILRKDQLTQFYNQRQKEDLFTSEIRKSVQNEYRIGLLLMDLDDFKQFNDNFGHLNGDNLLSQFGSLILNNIRPYDRPIRVGGEEFMIIAPKVDSKSLQSFAERLRVLIANHPFKDRFGEPSFGNISASIGVLLLDQIKQSVTNSEYYFEQVDNNLYEAKKKGKNRVEFSMC